MFFFISIQRQNRKVDYSAVPFLGVINCLWYHKGSGYYYFIFSVASSFARLFLTFELRFLCRVRLVPEEQNAKRNFDTPPPRIPSHQCPQPPPWGILQFSRCSYSWFVWRTRCCAGGMYTIAQKCSVCEMLKKVWQPPLHLAPKGDHFHIYDTFKIVSRAG